MALGNKYRNYCELFFVFLSVLSDLVVEPLLNYYSKLLISDFQILKGLETSFWESTIVLKATRNILRRQIIWANNHELTPKMTQKQE